MARILVVENEIELRRDFSSMFEQNQYEFCFAYRIENAIDLCKTRRPDLIVVDNSLPLLTGVTLLRHLKTPEALKDIPVLMITSAGNSIEQNLAVELGADDYIEKPFDPSPVRLRINTWIAHRALKSVAMKSLHAMDLARLKQDIKNPLAGIIATVQLLQMELRTERAESGLQYIKELAFRINSVLEDANESEKEFDSETLRLASTT